MTTATDALARTVSMVIARRGRALSLAAALGLASLPFAVLLYANLRAQIEELLPQSAPSLVALREMHARLGESIGLTVLVTGTPAQARHAMLDRLAAESHTLSIPARLVDYRSDELTGFFEPRKALFVNLPDLRKVERTVEDRVTREEARANPLFDLGLEEGEGGQEGTADELAKVLERYRGQVAELHAHPSGYYDSADDTASVILFYPAVGATSYEGAQAFFEEIDRMARRVGAEANLAGFRLEYTGDVQQVIQEQRSLLADLYLSSAIVAVLELLLLLGFYRWWPAMVVLGLPLALGTVVTFALGYFFIGSLNASSAFLGAIVVGNGVNSGVMLLSRFGEERRRGLPPLAASDAAVRGVAGATVVASLASAVAYAALMATSFRGYSHFGFMGGLGMVLCWVANMLLVPPLALWFEERFPMARDGRAARLDGAFGRLGRLGVGRAGVVVGVCTLLTAASLVAVAWIAPDPIEEDTTKMRSRWATEPGGYIEVGEKVDRILKRVTTPVVVLLQKLEDVPVVAQRYREKMEQGPPDQLLGQVLTVYSLVPDDQVEKLAILRRIRALLTPERLARLDAKTRQLAEDWLPPPGLKPFGPRDLPESLRRQFRERDGSEGKVVLLYPKYGTDTTDGRVLRRFAREVRSVPLPPGAAVAGSYLIFADMIGSLGQSGPRATAIAFLGVLLLSAALARGKGGGLVVTLSLLVGVAWTCGSGAAAGMRLNFLNFIALPITFGIGVDYAVNVYGRYRLGPPGRAELVSAIQNSGAAVAVASATTIIGYSSLLFSRNGAILSFGSLAVLGELSCLFSALVLLPAMVALKLPREKEAEASTASAE